MTATSRYTNTRGAADHLACSASYLEKCRVSRGGPRFHKIGKAVRYKFDELDAFAKARAWFDKGIPNARGYAGIGHAA